MLILYTLRRSSATEKEKRGRRKLYLRRTGWMASRLCIPLTPTQNDQGFNGQDTDLGADSGKSGFASGNENIDGQEEEAMGTRGEEDEWGGISYHIDGETGIETESPKGNVTKENADSQSQQAVVTHHIPPHLRNKQSELESEAITRLKKQLKGLLNRCAVPSTIFC
ncbi:suppressor of glycerol defect [Leucoagaricus gongylophorus]